MSIPPYIQQLNARQLRGYIAILTENLWRVKKYGWCAWMVDRWEELKYYALLEQNIREHQQQNSKP